MMSTHANTSTQSQSVGSTWVEPRRRDEVVREAVERGLDLQITRYGESGWVTYVSRFAAIKDNVTVLIEPPYRHEDNEFPSIDTGEQVGISFRRGRSKCLFTTTIIAANSESSDSGKDGTWLAIRWPENLQEMQRRAYQRVTPPPGQPIDLEVFKHCLSENQAESADIKPTGEALLRGRLSNLSAGGACIVTPCRPSFVENDLVIIRFAPRPDADPLLLDSRVRHIMPAPGNNWSVGFQFVGLESTTEGHCRLAELASIVTAFRRAAARN